MRWHHPTFRHWPRLARHYRRIVGLERDIIKAQQQQPSIDTRLPWQVPFVLLLVFLLWLVLTTCSLIVSS